MKKITVVAALALSLGIFSAKAQTACSDMNGYPQSKNVGGTGAYTLEAGMEENASQTYYYSGPGKIGGVRVYGYTPNWVTGVDLLVRVYQVDGNGRPTSVIGSRLVTWKWADNFNGFKDVSFYGGGYSLQNNFAVGIEMINGISSVTQFQLTYTGNGEGRGEDLASLAGTSTGSNWASAATAFSKDGDFYIIPKMVNYITSEFNASSVCTNANTSLTFTNTSEMTQDSMFNKIGMAGYAGTNHFYTWNFGDGSPVTNAVSPTHAYASAGTYTVSLTSYLEGWNNNCSDTYTMQISVGLNATVASAIAVSCYGASNGSINASATGGASPYTYSIDGENYSSTAGFTGLTAGSYTVYVKDAVGCVKTTTAQVAEPAAITFSQATSTNASCNNSDGAVQTLATGGIGSLQYSLDGTTWQSSGTFSNLPAAAYTVWVKDGNGCQNNTGVAVSNLGGPALTVNSITHISCFDVANGTIAVSATGGTGILQYSVDGIGFQSNGNFSGLPADTFFVTVKDASGCQDIKTVVLNQPAQLGFNVSSSATSCFGGTNGQVIIGGVSGGTGTMNYSIGGTSYQSSNTFSGISAGAYTVYVKDASGCIASHTTAVSQPPALYVNAVPSAASCNGSSNGSINAIASGGTPKYKFSLDGESYYPVGDFSELLAGTYTIMVMDAHGCMNSTTATVAQPTVITSTITVGASTCGNTNGNILIAAAGGSGSGYQYSINGITWNSSGSFVSLADSIYNILVQDGSGCENEFQAVVSNSNGPSITSVSSTNITCNNGHNGSITVTGVTGGSGTLMYHLGGHAWTTSTSFSGLEAGIYTVIVRDGLGCTGSYQVTLSEPAPIVVNTAVTGLTCSDLNNGSVTLTAGGGSGTMAYSLSGTVYQSGNVFTNLAPGTYDAYVRDAGSCIGTTSFTISSPLPIVISNSGVLDVRCNGSHDGALNVLANGGTGSFQYSIDGINYQSSGYFTALDGGLYTISVKDGNNCIETEVVTILEPSAISVTGAVSNVSCAGGHNGSITLNVTGGVPSYDYSWSNLAETSSISNLGAGNYSCSIWDENGCVQTYSTTITQPATPLIVNAVINDASGSTATDGSILLSVTGGTSPYVYDWSNGSTSIDNLNIAPGVYTVTITDDNGCVTSGVYTVGASVGLASPALSNGVKIYPNPADHFITVESANAVIDQVDVLNLIGEVIYTIAPKERKVTVSLENLSEGMYFIRYHSNNVSSTKRIIVK